ncbi:MAG TPA: L,D-transpeptidase family protein [Rhizomicrobium sp.]|jgi:L,D-peptidoglycan transpeptidase YkuD (ErfK/YbiS/YcfS/YnhG family)|nr:L,D-transpeptidase family protein [Rhizomicrobium sp.]
MTVIVTPHGAREALVDWGRGPRRAAIGRGGIAEKLCEGDGVTPLGTFAIRRLLYRADRLDAPRTGLPLAPIAPDDGWCDAPDDPLYNRQIKTPYAAGHETLWRDDGLYDLVLVLGFNDAPVIAGKGSAIFVHVARPDYSPTEGCIALARSDLTELLAGLGPGDTLTVRA